MFYSTELLIRQGPLSRVWQAAHLHHQLKKNEVMDTDLVQVVRALLEPSDAPKALRLSAQLLFGLARIYNKKVVYLEQDCVGALASIRLVCDSNKTDKQHPYTLPVASRQVGGKGRNAAANATVLPDYNEGDWGMMIDCVEAQMFQAAAQPGLQTRLLSQPVADELFLPLAALPVGPAAGLRRQSISTSSQSRGKGSKRYALLPAGKLTQEDDTRNARDQVQKANRARSRRTSISSSQHCSRAESLFAAVADAVTRQASQGTNHPADAGFAALFRSSQPGTQGLLPVVDEVFDVEAGDLNDLHINDQEIYPSPAGLHYASQEVELEVLRDAPSSAAAQRQRAHNLLADLNADPEAAKLLAQAGKSAHNHALLGIGGTPSTGRRDASIAGNMTDVAPGSRHSLQASAGLPTRQLPTRNLALRESSDSGLLDMNIDMAADLIPDLGMDASSPAIPILGTNPRVSMLQQQLGLNNDAFDREQANDVQHGLNAAQPEHNMQQRHEADDIAAVQDGLPSNVIAANGAVEAAAQGFAAGAHQQNNSMRYLGLPPKPAAAGGKKRPAAATGAASRPKRMAVQLKLIKAADLIDPIQPNIPPGTMGKKEYAATHKDTSKLLTRRGLGAYREQEAVNRPRAAMPSNGRMFMELPNVLLGFCGDMNDMLAAMDRRPMAVAMDQVESAHNTQPSQAQPSQPSQGLSQQPVAMLSPQRQSGSGAAPVPAAVTPPPSTRSARNGSAAGPAQQPEPDMQDDPMAYQAQAATPPIPSQQSPVFSLGQLQGWNGTPVGGGSSGLGHPHSNHTDNGEQGLALDELHHSTPLQHIDVAPPGIHLGSQNERIHYSWANHRTSSQARSSQGNASQHGATQEMLLTQLTARLTQQTEVTMQDLVASVPMSSNAPRLHASRCFFDMLVLYTTGRVGLEQEFGEHSSKGSQAEPIKCTQR